MRLQFLPVETTVSLRGNCSLTAWDCCFRPECFFGRTFGTYAEEDRLAYYLGGADGLLSLRYKKGVGENTRLRLWIVRLAFLEQLVYCFFEGCFALCSDLTLYHFAIFDKKDGWNVAY